MVRFYLEKVISQFTPVYGLYPRESLKNKISVYGYYLRNDIFVADRKNNSENNSDLNIMQ